ncbi:MAG: fasciclin domain-containing protein [Acidimicrobiales bacterium]
MRITRNRAGAIGIALALTLSVAACGSDSDGGSSSPTTEAATTTAASGDEALSPTGPGCAAVPKDGDGSFAGMAQDPAATAASNNPLLSTLVTAVGKADLVDTLNGPGPFTIFAPTNDAFAKIPEADLNAVLADKDTLTKILTLHVAEGKMSSADLEDAGTVTSLEGEDLKIEKSGDTFTVNGANVVCQDVPTANATVFIIDSVLMPGSADGTETAMEPTGPGCAAVPTEGDGSFAGMAEDPPPPRRPTTRCCPPW